MGLNSANKRGIMARKFPCFAVSNLNLEMGDLF